MPDLAPRFRVFLVGSALLILDGTAAGAAPKPRPQPRMLDARVNAPEARDNALRARPLAVSAAAAALARNGDMEPALAALRAAVPDLEIKRSRATGGLALLASRQGALTAPARGISDEQIVRGFLSQYGSAFGLAADDLGDLATLGDSPGGASGLRMLRLEQRIDGRPVFQSETRFLIDREGRLWRAVGQLVPRARASVAAPAGHSLGAPAAVVALLDSVDLAVEASAFTIDRREGGWTRLREATAAVNGEISAREVYFPLAPGLLVPAWALVVSTRDADWYAVVDAETGDVLWRKNIRESVSSHDARFRVYVQADGTTPADSPAPKSPTTAAPGAGTQFPEIAPTTMVSMHAAMNATASPNGWINDCPGGVCTANETQTLGNNVLACLDRTVTGLGNNVCDTAGGNSLDGNGRPTGNPDGAARNRDFFGTTPRDFETTFLPPPQGGNPESGQDPIQAAFGRGSVTQQFYNANWYHDQLFALGFDEAAGNFQVTNFSGMGLGGDRVLLDVQDGSGTDNANFSTPPDGVSGRAQMFIFPGPTIDRDGGLDAEVLLHELTHGTSNRLVGNAAGLNWDPARGMGEGWSDFFALSLLNNTNGDDPNGKYASGAYATYKLQYTLVDFLTDNYVYGIRRFPYSTNNAVNPLTWADVSDVSYDESGGIAPSPVNFAFAGAAEVHNIGEIWALTLWEVRSRVIADPAGANGDVPTGNQTLLELVTDGLKLTPVDPTFVEARDAILDADCAANACANETSIWGGFADRGLGYGAQSPYSVAIGIAVNSHMGVVESFAMPHLDVVDPQTDVAIDDSAANNNGAIEPNETVELTVALTNPWRGAGQAVTSATATLSTSTPGVLITDGTSSYGAIAPQGSGSGDPFEIAIGAGVPCGSALTFTMTTTSNLGTTATSFVLRVGQANGTDSVVTITKDTNPPLSVPDGALQGVFDGLTVGDDLVIADLDLRVDSLAHTFVGDLNVMLQAPDGRGIDLVGWIGAGVNLDFGSGDNLTNTIIDDDQPFDLAHDMVFADEATQSPGYDGPYHPIYDTLPSDFVPPLSPDAAGDLSRFDGLSTKGDWKLLVADNFEADEGTLDAWSLRVTPVHFDCEAPASMTPTALVIDPLPGNGVLEAGEAPVTVKPEWTNFTGGTVGSLTGTASNFTGPSPGPVTYTLTDAAASYGTITNGGSAACGDCYGVSITGSRPVAHWDATFLETLSTGEVKTWLLHVGASFSDVPPSAPPSFYLPIETLFHHNATLGCGGGRFCPADSVTRAQLAVVVIRALDESVGACAGTFADVLPGNLYCPFIEKAAALGIFTSCDGGANFCPDLSVNREQTAMYVIRAVAPGFTPPACGGQPYDDVLIANPFCKWINDLKTRGFAGKCAGVNNFCPSGPLTREAVAALLVRAKALKLYEP